MFKDKYNVIGVMSGTSLDGVDLVYTTLSFSNKWSYKVHYSETIPYTEYWHSTLSKSVYLEKAALLKLDEEYTNELAKIISDFINKNNITAIDAICSHGHTALHEPQNNYTLQIGNLSKIAKLLNETVVCDFRVQDVQFGGQGAPLVPIGDRLLFSEYDYCLNLGGFSNISFEENKKRIAFDISPVNTVLNLYANKLNLAYDDKGQIAKKGNINVSLLVELNNLNYYSKKHPKSLGVEFVNTEILPIINQYKIKTEDILRTFTEHVAIQISNVIKKEKSSLLITGGGAYHDFLINRIKHFLPNTNIIIPDRIILEFKEALVFALLGILRLRNENNTLCSVTGAKQDHSSGNIFIP